MVSNNLCDVIWLKKCYLVLIEQNIFINKTYGVRGLDTPLSYAIFASSITIFNCIAPLWSLLYRCEKTYKHRDEIISTVDNILIGRNIMHTHTTIMPLGLLGSNSLHPARPRRPVHEKRSVLSPRRGPTGWTTGSCRCYYTVSRLSLPGPSMRSDLCSLRGVVLDRPVRFTNGGSYRLDYGLVSLLLYCIKALSSRPVHEKRPVLSPRRGPTGWTMGSCRCYYTVSKLSLPGPSMRSDLSSLRGLVLDRPVRFTTGGFYRLDYGLLVTFGSVVSTYTLLMLQTLK
ncbi:uncharacterized protein LOC135084379 [Ostrinia nubilalis]|uniref:uncharacterized protein LOC135084379 n=1 Tax=Ostrinia nubilalis TaxID=29057 RepID=UPI003082261E